MRPKLYLFNTLYLSKSVELKFRCEFLTYRKTSKRDLDVGVDQVARLRAESVLQVGHQGGVHPKRVR